MNLPDKAGYIARRNSRGRVSGKTHLWNGQDTMCRMWSSGGLQAKHQYRYFFAPPSEFCSNCHADRHVIEEQPFELRGY